MKTFAIHVNKEEGWITVNTYIVPPTLLSRIVPVSVELDTYSDAKVAHWIMCAASYPNVYSVFDCKRIETRVVEAPTEVREQEELAHTD
jgi:hypothetical protein